MGTAAEGAESGAAGASSGAGGGAGALSSSGGTPSFDTGGTISGVGLDSPSTSGNGPVASAQTPSWQQQIGSAISDYSKGASGNLSDAMKGNTAQQVGYGVNKVSSMAPGTQAPPQIQLPQAQARPQSAYRTLYEKMLAQRGY